MDRPGVRWAIAAVIACIAAVSAIVLAANRTARPPVLIYDGTAADAAPAAPHGDHPPASAPTSASSASSAGKMYVHVAGAVKHPGLYLLPAGSRVAGAIQAAGGAAADADIDAVNLAERVSDGEKVYVPRHGATDASPSAGAGNTIGYSSTGPEPAATPTAAGSSSTSAGRTRAAKTLPSHPINLNTATAEQLQSLPGVGPATAAHILEFRHRNGGFRRVEDLMEVGGIGEKKLAKLRPYVSVR